MGTFSNTWGNMGGGQGVLLNQIPFKSDLSFHTIGRNGLTMIDEISGNNASILMPYIDLVSNGRYFYVSDNDALSIGTSDFTIAFWVKCNTIDNSSNRVFLGKFDGVVHDGQFGFYKAASTGNLAIEVHTSTGNKLINSGISMTNAGWLFVVLQIDQAVDNMKMFINNAQVGSIACGGTFGTWADPFKFTVNCATGPTGNTSSSGFASSYSDIQIFHRLLSTEEKTTLYSKGFVSDPALYIPCNNEMLFDITNNFTVVSNIVYSIYSTNFNYIKYSEFGTRILLDKGYSLFTKKSYPDVQIPYHPNGTPTTITLTGYTRLKDVPAIATNHNLSDSVINIPVLDRSDALIFKDKARLREYNSLSVNDFHISEINQGVLYEYLTDSNKGLFFPKIINNSVSERNSRIELIKYVTPKTGTDFAKVLSYTKDKNNYPKNVAGVCLSFDDNLRVDSWINVDSELYEKYQWKCTGYLNTGLEALLSAIEEIWERFKNRGHEIGNHTLNHIHWITYLQTHTAQEFYDTEVAPAQTLLTTYHGAPKTYGYAQDYGAAGNAELNTLLLSEGFQFVRPGTNIKPAIGSTIYYNGTSQVVAALDLSTVGLTESDIIAYIEYAKNNNSIVLFVGHTIGTETSQFMQSIDLIKHICEYVVNNKMSFYRCDELLPSLFQ